MTDIAKLTTLQSETDRNRYDFVATDMKVVSTFLTIAAREEADGHIDRAKLLLARVARAFELIDRVKARIEDPGLCRAIASQLRFLHDEANSLQKKLEAQ